MAIDNTQLFPETDPSKSPQSSKSPKSPQAPKGSQKTQEPTTPQIEQRRFYRDQLGSILLLIGLMASLVGVLIFLILLLQPLRNPPPLFFKASENAELIQETPLDQANFTPPVLFNWLVDAMITSHSFNFANYGTRLEKAKAYFTPEGYESFTQALREAHVFEQVVNKKYVFRGMPTAAPQITKEGVLANRYLWKLKMPMVFQYRNVTEPFTNDADLNILIVRVPTTVAPFGIKILRYELVVHQGTATR